MRTDTLGLILAGGLARRMGGGDKPLRRVGGRTVLARVVDALRKQVGALLLNANGDPARFATAGLPLLADTRPDRLGPLAGVLAIATADIAVLAKLYAEAIENIEPRQTEGVTAAGGGWAERLRFGVLPQVLPVMLAQALYFFESNTRSAAILGVVGAGGIGLQISERIRVRAWDEVAFIILLMVVIVAAIDWGSARLRKRLIGG